MRPRRDMRQSPTVLIGPGDETPGLLKGMRKW